MNDLGSKNVEPSKAIGNAKTIARYNVNNLLNYILEASIGVRAFSKCVLSNIATAMVKWIEAVI